MRRRDFPKALLASAAGSALLAGQSTQAQTCGHRRYEQTRAETDAHVTPVRYEYEPGDVRRYGTVLDTVTLTKWARVGGDLRFPVAQTATVTAAIALMSNSTITFAKGATIQTATPNISLFSAVSQRRIKISGGRFKQTVAGRAAYVAGVTLCDCRYCEVSDCEFDGMQWAGVYLDSSSHCDIAHNHFHDFLSSAAGDKADIIVYRNSSYNMVRDNRCFGGTSANHGILVQDPLGLGNWLPQHNKVLNNWVGDHSGYGIAVYIGGNQDSYNQVIGNTVQNITGTYIRGQSGAGIYCVGSGLGGLQVVNNIVRNCCSATLSTINGPAGITIAGPLQGSVRSVVSGNTVEGMLQGCGILIVGAEGGASVFGNTVRMPDANKGSGPGGAALGGEGIKVVNSPDVAVTGNSVLQNGARDAFLSLLTSNSSNQVNVTGNIFRAASGNALRFDRTSSHIHADCVVSGNQLRCDGGGNALFLIGTDRVSVTGNNGCANTGDAMVFSACTDTRVANNVFNTNATVGMTASGTCTGSNCDATNRVSGIVMNLATGFRIEQLACAAPTAGTYVAGDSVWYRTPDPGSPPGVVCTAGGTPGTWKAMAPLAM